MKLFNKLPGYQRSPPGLERRILRKLPLIWLTGTLLPLAASAFRYGMNLLEPGADGERAVEQFFYVMVGLVGLHWILVFALAVGCGIVVLMKGPAYVADAYHPQDKPDRP
jgi:hypothetical protein